MSQRASQSIWQGQLTSETMPDKGLVGVAILLVVLLLYLLVCKIWQRFAKSSDSSDKGGEVTESLISEDLSVGQTLRRAVLPRWHADGDTSVSGEHHFNSSIIYNDVDKHTISTSQEIATQCSNLVLEVISGPSSGVRISQHSINASGLSLKIGRVSQNDLVLNDPEVSGKHAIIYWNLKNSKWELADMGSLNGTLLNSQPICTPGPRHRSDSVELASGDIVTLGSTSKVLVQIVDRDVSQFSLLSVPFGVGIASDPMNVRKGGKQLPMEDVCHCEWPLCGIQQFGVFCIFDGHGGAAAAEAASKIMPRKLADILMVPERRQAVLLNCDATDVLLDAFRETEAALDNQYEGCTATVLLLWSNLKGDIFAQCANVGDSACIFRIGDENICMTEDHRLTSMSEKTRMLEIGKQLKEGETRLCGMNIARVLGDKFLKEQDSRFSAEPYVSEALRITSERKALAVLASDGLWDVLSHKRALQLALEARDGHHMDEGNVFCAEEIANLFVKEARMLRTKDNTTVIVLDFATSNRSCKVLDCKKIETISMHN